MLGILKKYNEIFLTGMYCICILPFLSIADLHNQLGIIYPAWLVIAMFFFGCRLLYKISKQDCTLDKFHWAFLIYQIVVCATSIYNKTFSWGMLVVSISTSMLILLMQYDAKKILEGLVVSIIALSLVNFGSVCLNFTKKEVFFIGGKNQLSMTLIPTIFFIIIYSIHQTGGINKFAICAALINFMSILLGGSGTGIIVCGIAILAIIGQQAFKYKKVLMGLVVGLNIGLICLSNLWLDSPIWIWITKLLGKSNSLTGRTDVWQLFLDKLNVNWIFGNGKGAEVFYIDQWGDKRIFNEAHNIFLEIFSCSGAVGFFIYIFYFCNAFLNLDYKQKEQRYISIAIFIMLINGLTESINNNIMFILMVAFAHNCVFEHHAQNSLQVLAKK